MKANLFGKTINFRETELMGDNREKNHMGLLYLYNIYASCGTFVVEPFTS